MEEDHDSHPPATTAALADAEDEEEPPMSAWDRFKHYEEDEGFEEL